MRAQVLQVLAGTLVAFLSVYMIRSYGLALGYSRAHNLTMFEVLVNTDCYKTTPRNPVCVPIIEDAGQPISSRVFSTTWNVFTLVWNAAAPISGLLNWIVMGTFFSVLKYTTKVVRFFLQRY